MVSEILIAHELGHAIAGILQDNLYWPESITLYGSKGILACCEFDDRPRKITGRFGKFKYMSDLGGLYGELIIEGSWNPWSARSDLDSFNCENTSNISKISELDQWLWMDDDDLSFRACTKLFPIKERRFFKLDAHETFKRLPFIWDAFCDFCDKINKNEFKTIVKEIRKNEEEVLDQKQIEDYAKRIITCEY